MGFKEITLIIRGVEVRIRHCKMKGANIFGPEVVSFSVKDLEDFGR